MGIRSMLRRTFFSACGGGVGGGGGGGCEIVGRANRQGQPRGGGGSVGLVGST